VPSLDSAAPTELYFTASSSQRLFAKFVVGIWACIFVMIDFIPILAPGASLTGRVLGVVIITCMGVLTVLWLERFIVRPWVKATPSDLCIYNGFRVHIVPWSDIVGFGESSWRPFQMTVKRAHNRPVPMPGIWGGWFGNRKQQFEKMHELEAYWHHVLLNEQKRMRSADSENS
jgi:hypothetical protein